MLLDRSYSMGYGDRWTRAQAAARTGDRRSRRRPIGPASCFFGTGAEVALQSIDDRARLTAAIAAATPGAEATRYAPALKVAGTIVVESTRPRKEVVLISDFQKNGWAPSDDQRLPAGTTFTPVLGHRRRHAESVGDAGGGAPGPLRGPGARHDHRRGHQPRQRAGRRRDAHARDRTAASSRPPRVDVAPQAAASHVFAPVTLTPGRLARRGPRRRRRAGRRQRLPLRAARRPGRSRCCWPGRADAAADDTYLRRALAIGEAPRFEVTATTLDAAHRRRAGARRGGASCNDAPLGDAAIARLVALRRARRRRAGGRRQPGVVAAGRGAARHAGRSGRSLARRRRPAERRRVRPRGLRAVPRSAQRRLLERARLRLPAPDAGRPTRGCWPASTTASRRWSSARSAAAASWCGPRASTWRGTTWR